MQLREASIIVFMLQATIISRLKFFNLVESLFPELGLGEKRNWESTQVKKNLNLILTCNNYNNYQNQTTRGFPGGHSQKTPLSLRINAFNAKVLIEELRALLFTSPVGDGTAILRGHPSLVVQPLVEQRQYFHSQLFWDPEYWSGPGDQTREVKHQGPVVRRPISA